MNQNKMLIAILVGTIVFMGTLFLLQNNNYNNVKEKFTAVFLQTGQVYFGNVIEETSDKLVIKNVYYLQFAQNNNSNIDQVNSLEFNLIKRGQELHGPEDKMIINKQFILFTEDLRDDSKILDKINSSL